MLTNVWSGLGYEIYISYDFDGNILLLFFSLFEFNNGCDLHQKQFPFLPCHLVKTTNRLNLSVSITLVKMTHSWQSTVSHKPCLVLCSFLVATQPLTFHLPASFVLKHTLESLNTVPVSHVSLLAWPAPCPDIELYWEVPAQYTLHTDYIAEFYFFQSSYLKSYNFF